MLSWHVLAIVKCPSFKRYPPFIVWQLPYSLKDGKIGLNPIDLA